MKSLLFSGLTFGLVVVASAWAGDAGKKDQELLQGVWKLIRMEEGGEKAPENVLKAMSIKIAGNKLSVFEKDKVVAELSFKLDPAKKPKAVDFTHLVGDDKGKTEAGIYALDGDQVTFCANSAGKPRPAEFVSKKGSDAGLFVLQRAK
jgi:uncharacterized protein (TIGR03067 family)